MIRFIIETRTSNTDTNGNRYHYAIVTSAKTKKTLHLDSVGGDQNAVHTVKDKLGLDWNEVYAVNSSYPIREWQRLNKYHPKGWYEHEVTADMLTALEAA